MARRRLGRRTLALGLIGPLATVAWASWHAGDVLDGRVLSERVEWVPSLGLGLDLRLDAFGLLAVTLVSGVGALVFAYGLGYFGPRSPGVGRLGGLLTLFSGAMLGLVLADNLLFLFLCWELTSITSYLLIGNDDRDAEARAAALHALLVTGAGGLAMLGGFIVLGAEAGTFRMSEMLADPPSGGPVNVALVLVLLGAFTKSAQYPFHSWLPGAMVAPTPVSAYLHSAAMVKAGLVLVARFAPAFADAGPWRPLVVGVGLTTMVAGGLRALRRYDLKLLLAHGTVSQLGFLMVLLGFGSDDATVAGCALLLAHGAFKAALFMVVGVVDHQAGTRDLRLLPALGPGWGATKVVAIVSAASMAGLPPLMGFVAKEAAYEAFVEGDAGEMIVLAGIVVGSVITMAYSLRFVWGLLSPQPTSYFIAAPRGSGQPASGPVPAPAWGFLAPAAGLAVVTVVLGVFPSLESALIDAASVSVNRGAHAHLALWHGVNPPLVLTGITVALGGLLFLGRRKVAMAQATLAPQASALGGYKATVRGVARLSAGVTQVAQPGSLPVYLSVIVLTAAVVPGMGLVLGDAWWPGLPDLVEEPAYLLPSAVIVGGAIAAAFASRRFTAALLLGTVGYGIALLFVVMGAPDLALTQFAIETVSVVLFLLVLRRLPDEFGARSPSPARWARVGVGAVVAGFVFVLALAAGGARVEEPISGEIVERAYPDGGGRNIVNVILVDFRGFDTLGEITVLAVAAVGATALTRAGRRPAALTADGPPDDGLPPDDDNGDGGAQDEASDDDEGRHP